LTIELKDQIPTAFKNKMDDWAFGCDVCQDVCPWNRFSKQHNEPLFSPNSEVINYTKKNWEEITQETFNIIFKNSAIKRTGFKGLKRNISFLKE
jgi:epoxyqueuosine reductase